MKGITVDYSKRLAEEPGKGRNRWHESIAPLIEAAPGEELEPVDVPNFVVSAFLPLDIFGQ
jgi:hypothetical protein